METAEKYPKNTIPGWIDELEARELLGCKNTKLWAIRKRGEVTYSKIGSKTFYKLTSIAELLEKNMIVS